MAEVLVWTGDELKMVKETEARKMVEADQAQIMDELNGENLKYKNEFTGYSNKAMATNVASEVAPVEAAPVEAAPVEPDPVETPPKKKRGRPRKTPVDG